MLRVVYDRRLWSIEACASVDEDSCGRILSVTMGDEVSCDLCGVGGVWWIPFGYDGGLRVAGRVCRIGEYDLLRRSG